MYLTLLLCSYFYQGDLLYSTKFQVAYFELSYSWVRKIPGRRERLPTPVFLGFPCGSAGKESAYNVGNLGSIAGLGRSPGEGKGQTLQCSGLENSMNCIVHGDANRHDWVTFTFYFGLWWLPDYSQTTVEQGSKRWHSTTCWLLSNAFNGSNNW